MWFYSTIALICVSLVLAVALWIALSRKATSSVEPRLLGTWISDADRTMEMMPASTDVGSEAFQDVKVHLGKMRISYSPKEMVIALDDQIEKVAYQVLATDEYSCVIAGTSARPEIDKETADILRISSYNVIHFEDQNLYWVYSQFGGFAEYFRRLPE